MCHIFSQLAGLTGIERWQLSLADRGCGATENSSHLILQTGLEGCGMLVRSQPGGRLYQNAVGPSVQALRVSYLLFWTSHNAAVGYGECHILLDPSSLLQRLGHSCSLLGCYVPKCKKLGEKRSM